jgi:hypothetical protein
MAQPLLSNPDQAPEVNLGRHALGGISAVVAVAMAISAVLGTWTAGVLQADRMSDGLVARSVTAAIVRHVERARVREVDVPAIASGDWRGRDAIDAAGRLVLSQVEGSVGLSRLGLREIDLPPPMMA